MQLELQQNPVACFVTLTYDDEHLPSDGNVSKRDCQLWLKRLREKIYPRLLRYFLAAEYGEENGRPHYHAIVYGVGPVESELLSSTWTQGFVHVGLAEPKSMSYVSGYVLKKWGKREQYLNPNKTPEFQLRSLRPGIGAVAVHALVTAYRSPGGQIALEKLGWLSPLVRIGPKIYPLGRYLSTKVANELHLTKEMKKLHLMRQVLRTYEENRHLTASEYHQKRKAEVEQQEGKIAIHTAPGRRRL